MEARVKISSGTRTVEIEGSETFVLEQLDALRGVWETSSPNDEAEPVGDSEGASFVNTGQSSSRPSELPGTFGEYLTTFRRGLNQVDQMLIAAYFAQRNNSENVFTTEEASMLLQEQGIKVNSPSMAITNNKKARRLFSTQKGQFRLTPDGIDHIESLHNQ